MSLFRRYWRWFALLTAVGLTLMLGILLVSNTFVTDLRNQDDSATIEANVNGEQNSEIVAQNAEEESQSVEAEENQDSGQLADNLNLSPEVVEEVNRLLRPQGAEYPTEESDLGLKIDVSRRAAAVPVAVLNEDGEVAVVDVTEPITDNP